MIKKYKLLKQRAITVRWDKPWQEEAAVLKKLISERNEYSPDPIYDSMFQFKAQTSSLNFLEKTLLYIISLFGFIVLTCKYFLFSKSGVADPQKYDAAYFYSDSIFSKEIKANKKIVFIESNKGKLVFTDLIFLFKLLFKLRLNFGLLSIAVFRISQIRYAIDKYHVSNIWSNMEYSSATGIIRKYCNNNNILFSNFMHGEKVLSLREAFCSFDVLYVWDNHYKSIFEQLQCRGKIIVDNPWTRQNTITPNKKTLCYILKGIETNKEIEILRAAFGKLKDLGYLVALKDHPRQYSISNKMPEFEKVDSKKNIYDITAEFEYVVAQFSTVLFQAWCFGAKILLDDLSNPALIGALAERDYVFSTPQKGVDVLSTFINGKLITTA